MAEHAADTTGAGATGVRTPARDTRTRPATVVVHGSEVHVERADFEQPMAGARSRYGGVDGPMSTGTDAPVNASAEAHHHASTTRPTAASTGGTR